LATTAALFGMTVHQVSLRQMVNNHRRVEPKWGVLSTSTRLWCGCWNVSKFL